MREGPRAKICVAAPPEKGKANEAVIRLLASLLGVHRRGAELQRLDADTTLRRSLRNYVSSVAVDRTGGLAVVTSSRGKHAVIIDIAARRVIAHRRIFDVSGDENSPRRL